MKVLLIKGSPHKNGSSNLLADHFARGASEAGHTVSYFDAAHADIKPCTGCMACGMAGPCVQKDEMAVLREEILAAELLAFVTPLYYFGFSAQLKTVLDRFYSFNGELSAKGMQTVLIAAAWDSRAEALKCLRDHYQYLCSYMNFHDRGMVLGSGCGSPAMTQGSKYPQLAYELGCSL